MASPTTPDSRAYVCRATHTYAAHDCSHAHTTECLLMVGVVIVSEIQISRCSLVTRLTYLFFCTRQWKLPFLYRITVRTLACIWFETRANVEGRGSRLPRSARGAQRVTQEIASFWSHDFGTEFYAKRYLMMRHQSHEIFKLR